MSEFEIMGQDAVSGVGFIPNRVNIFQNDFLILGTPIMKVGQPTTGTAAMSAVNDYVSFTVIPYRSLTINRLVFRVNGISSPVGFTITGGVALFDSSTGYPTQSSSVITFIQSGTTTTFVAGAYSSITLGSNATLTAGTKYSIAFQVTARTSGTVTLNHRWAGNYLSSAYFPSYQTRVAGTESKGSGTIFTMNYGYNDGSSTTWYSYSPEGFAQGSGQTVNRSTAPIYYENGVKFAIKYDVQEIEIIGITAHVQINVNALCVLSLYDSDGTTLIASGSVFGNQILINNDERLVFFNFSSKVLLKPHKYYYAMIADPLGSPTNTNPTLWVAMTQEDQNYDNNSDIYNIEVTRASAGGAITEVPTNKKLFYFNITNVIYQSRRSNQAGM